MLRLTQTGFNLFTVYGFNTALLVKCSYSLQQDGFWLAVIVFIVHQLDG